MLVIAHRGANKEALENSWSAFEAAVNSKAMRIELDILLTKDHVPVINHDDSLKRTTGLDKKLSELTYSELQQIKLLNGEPIPRLEDVLKHFLDKIEFNIELKGNNKEVAHYTCEVVKKFAQLDKIIFSSFDDLPLLYLRDEFSHVRRAFLWGDIVLGMKKPFLSNPETMMNKYKTNIFHPHAELYTEDLQQIALKNNWIVFPWTSLKGTEDDEVKRMALWGKLVKLKVDGLCTNYPRELAAWLDSNGKN